MSELILQSNDCASIRWKLLVGTSAIALAVYLAAMPSAKADSEDRPTVWIEVGGQFNRLQENQEIFSPPFLTLTPSDFPSPLSEERPPRYGFDESGSVTLQPKDSAWRFSASLRYGRSSANNHAHHQSYPGPYSKYLINRAGVKAYFPTYPQAARFADVIAKQSESHTIVDFQAGRDFGVGLFGKNSSASLNAGVRFAQFYSKSRIALKADPDWRFEAELYATSFGGGFYVQYVFQPFHSFAGTLSAERSFRGVGPSVSWSSSLPFSGDPQGGELTFDWGLNGALLFGRQKAHTHHQTTGRYHSAGSHYNFVSWAHLPVMYQNPVTPDHTRSRNVVVPNVGGFAGMSFRYQNAKVSFGYKADFFFGAIDGGIDVRRTEDVGFHGPYASVSIGLGG